jgi:hypothetical protein
MSKGLTVIHSHSGLERNLKLPKYVVLVDANFASVFHKYGIGTKPYKYNNVDYIKVRTLDFVKVGGVFKNLDC